MRICLDHWAMMRASIEAHGMSELVAKSGKEAADNAMTELQGEEAPFDPLMSMNWHFHSQALQGGGLYLMGDAGSENDGHYCPLCELDRHIPAFDPNEAIDLVAAQMLEYVRKEGLIREA